MKRKKISMRKSKKLFAKTADRIHRKNVAPPPMRGGYAL